MMEWLIFNVPELARQPILGGGCCAVASTWLVEETLAGQPGVYEVRADDQHGTVAVQIDAERIDGRAIREELDGLGFHPSAVETLGGRGAL